MLRSESALIMNQSKLTCKYNGLSSNDYYFICLILICIWIVQASEVSLWIVTNVKKVIWLYILMLLKVKYACLWIEIVEFCMFFTRGNLCIMWLIVTFSICPFEDHHNCSFWFVTNFGNSASYPHIRKRKIRIFCGFFFQCIDRAFIRSTADSERPA